MNYIVGRHINGIALNELEYLLDADGDEMLFESVEAAEGFLRGVGFTEDEIYYFVFEEVKKQ